MQRPFFKKDSSSSTTDSYALHKAVVGGELAEVEAVIQQAVLKNRLERATKIVMEEAKSLFPSGFSQIELKNQVKAVASKLEESDSTKAEFIKQFVNTKSKAGNLPLHEGLRALAALQNMSASLPGIVANIDKITQNINYLINNGADVNLKNNASHSAIEVYLNSLRVRILPVVAEDSTAIKNVQNEVDNLIITPLAEIVASFVPPPSEERVANLIARICSQSSQKITPEQIKELQKKKYFYLAAQLEPYCVNESPDVHFLPPTRKS